MTSYEDLEWRHPTPDDAADWAELMRAVEVVDTTGEHFSAEDLADEFTAPRRETNNAWFGWDGDGRLCAFGWVAGNPEAVDLHRVYAWGAVRPDLRRRGIGTELLAWLEERGRAIHTAFGRGVDGVVEVGCIVDNVGQRALFERAGYEPLRYWFEMRRPVDTTVDVTLPPGLDIRPFDPGLVEAVRRAHNEAFLDHWGSSPRSEETWRHDVIGRYFVPEASFVAFDGDEVAGYLVSHHYEADAEVKGYREGWINTVGTRRAWRGRGVASALIAAAIGAYGDAGYEYACLGVDAANPTGALALYERLGFETFKSQVSFAKPI